MRADHQDVTIDRKEASTQVGLFILIEDEFRRHGWAASVITEMKNLAGRRHLASLIIPLRPPRYQKEYAGMSMQEFAALKREDGLPLDHGVRRHVRLGAKETGVSGTSHQHAFFLRDFCRMFPVSPVARSGHTFVQQKDGGWYNLYVDLESEFVLVNQGCVRVQHPVRQ